MGGSFCKCSTHSFEDGRHDGPIFGTWFTTSLRERFSDCVKLTKSPWRQENVVLAIVVVVGHSLHYVFMYHTFST